MKSRRQNVSEGRQTKSSRTISNDENSEPIPIDLMIEVLSRLPSKSIARCRCISKLWASTLRLPYFTELFHTNSSARPKLLFTCEKDNKVFFFSSDQPQNPDENSFSVAANYHMNSSVYHGYCGLFTSISGLVCFRDKRILKGRKNARFVPVICNPSTRQSLILPKVKTRKLGVTSFFGYDPINKQIKLLSMTCPIYERNGDICSEHQVLTLGTKKLTWRMIECCIPHYCRGEGICINGVLYYLASVNKSSSNSMILCFDVRSEKFSFIKVMENLIGKVWDGTLVNYNGKLGLLNPERFSNLTRKSKSIVLWVLQDAKKHEWSKRICVLPPLWQNLVGDATLDIVGMIGTNEILLSPLYHPIGPFYVYYYNIEKNTVTRVGVQGMEAFKHSRLDIFLNHVENVELMQAI